MLNLSLEILCGGAAIFLQAAYLCLRLKKTISTILVISILSLPAFFLSIESMNSFLTCDESYIVYEPVDIIGNPLLMWKMAAFRTTDMFVGIPLALIKSMTGFSMDILAVFGKSIHWLLSFMLVLFVIDMILLLSGQTVCSICLYLTVFYSIMALPVVLLAAKIINYDAFSMLCGAASLLLLANSWKRCQPLLMYIVIVFATLAAQEKLIASPILWMVIVAVPLRIAITNAGSNRPDSFYKIWKETLISVLIAVMVLLITHITVSLTNSRGEPGNNAFVLFYPLIKGFWPFYRSWKTAFDFFACCDFFNHSYSIPLVALIIAVVMMLFNSIILMVCRVLMCCRIQLASLIKQYSGRIIVINYLIFFFLYVTGIAGTYFIRAFLAPYYQVAPGSYQPYTFNNAFVYFGAESITAHLAYSIVWAYATFANAIPGVFVVAAVINLVLTKCKRAAVNLIIEAIFTISFLMPLLYGLLQVPVGNRYFNIYLLLAVAKIIIDYSYGLKNNHTAFAKTFLFIFLLLAEIFPFRPAFVTFRPIWSNYSSTYNSTPSKAMLNPWGMGWGEEVFISGKRIWKSFHKENASLSGVTIYSNYLGEWLHRKNDARIIQLDSVDNIGYTENDFFVLNRMGIAQSSLNFPEGIRPFGTISFRGYVQAWIFRGSELESAGFRFKK